MWYGVLDEHYILWLEDSSPETSEWSELVDSDRFLEDATGSGRKTDHFGQNRGVIIFRGQHAGGGGSAVRIVEPGGGSGPPAPLIFHSGSQGDTAAAKNQINNPSSITMAKEHPKAWALDVCFFFLPRASFIFLTALLPPSPRQPFGDL